MKINYNILNTYFNIIFLKLIKLFFFLFRYRVPNPPNYNNYYYNYYKNSKYNNMCPKNSLFFFFLILFINFFKGIKYITMFIVPRNTITITWLSLSFIRYILIITN